MALLPDTPEYKKAHRQFLKATKNRPTNIDQDWTVFRAAEKRFKSRFPPPDLSDVLDLASRCGNDFPEHERGHWVGSPTVVDYVNVSLGDQNPAAFSVPRVPGAPIFFVMTRCRIATLAGLIILPGFLSPQKQKDLIYWSLTQHARQPNETNLDAHYVVPEAGLWNAYLKARKDPKQNIRVQPKASTSKEISQFHTGPRELINNTPASPESFEVIYKTPKLPASPSPTIQPSPITSLIFKLRWANIGWYYHWGTKQYDFTRGPGKISDDLVSLCKQAVRSVDWGKVHFSRGPEWGKNGPDWHTWNETYGKMTMGVYLRRHQMLATRTRCRNRKFLSRKGMLEN